MCFNFLFMSVRHVQVTTVSQHTVSVSRPVRPGCALFRVRTSSPNSSPLHLIRVRSVLTPTALATQHFLGRRRLLESCVPPALPTQLVVFARSPRRMTASHVMCGACVVADRRAWRVQFPVSIIGYFMFRDQVITSTQAKFIVVNIIGGFIYSAAKIKVRPGLSTCGHSFFERDDLKLRRLLTPPAPRLSP